jgi:hypothetical protein
MFTLECPKCNHQFCGTCLKETWKIPVGKGEPNGLGVYVAEEDLICCSCRTVNIGRFWHKKKIVATSKSGTDGQLDFFKE